MAKEKCAKESQRHGDSGKKPFIAHFDGGARYVARSGVGQLTHAIVRARSSPFSAVKMGGPFSLRCLSPLCSPAVGVGQAYPLRVGMTPVAWRSCSAEYEGFCFRRSRRGAGLPLGVISESHRPAGFGGASHEACHRMAVCAIQAAGSHTRPASREACRRAAVASRPTGMSPEQPRALWARCGVQGIALPDPRATRPVAEWR